MGSINLFRPILNFNLDQKSNLRYTLTRSNFQHSLVIAEKSKESFKYVN